MFLEPGDEILVPDGHNVMADRLGWQFSRENRVAHDIDTDQEQIGCFMQRV
jgi:hypothetical protein